MGAEGTRVLRPQQPQIRHLRFPESNIAERELHGGVHLLGKVLHQREPARVGD